MEIVSSGTSKNLRRRRGASTPLLRFTFQRPCFSGLESIAHQPIIPEHIWSTIENPITFTNPEPVGTGPFTKILRFDSQIRELGRNQITGKKANPKSICCVFRLSLKRTIHFGFATRRSRLGRKFFSGAIDRFCIQRPRKSSLLVSSVGTFFFIQIIPKSI